MNAKFPPSESLQSTSIRQTQQTLTMLHTDASWHMHTLLKSDWSQTGNSSGVGDKLRVIFSNAKDQARSQHTHHGDYQRLSQTKINPMHRDNWFL